ATTLTTPHWPGTPHPPGEPATPMSLTTAPASGTLHTETAGPLTTTLTSSADRPALVVAALTVAAAVAGVLTFRALRDATQAQAHRAYAALKQRITRWTRISGWTLTGLVAGFVASALTGHPLLAGLVFWAGTLLAAGDLLLQLAGTGILQAAG